MKKLYTLALGMMVATTLIAQSTGRNGSEVNSGGNRVVYSSSSESSGSSSSTTKTNYNSGSSNSHTHTSAYSEKNTHSDYHHHSSGNVSSARRAEKKDIYVEETVKNIYVDKREVEKESNRSGITKVNRGLDIPSYDEKMKGKGDNTVSLDQNGNTTNTSADTISYGLSAEKTTYKNNGLRIDDRVITCDDMMYSGRNRRWEVLSNYELYDLSEVRRCVDQLSFEDKWIVSCDEFENSSEDRKKHILNYHQFYDIRQLKNCATYQEYLKSFAPETEE